uniref:peroxidase N1-like n=1 Tax=Erigeron canadensis TaxID=72917 RepID=UPI001CB8B9A6|nr:peroxidase N1-like [Erigeron canadensis]
MTVYFHMKTTPNLFVVLLAISSIRVLGCTRVGFYEKTCPRAEIIVQDVVKSAVKANYTYAPGLLRMFFHDCFVRGCDASILLNGPSTEQTATPNSHLRGFEVINRAKTMLENECPGVVSCADILALAARDAVIQTGGTFWEVPTGRRDGLVSLKSEAEDLPSSRTPAEDQIKIFAKKGLNTEDLVTLAGGHTIGTAACARFTDRLYNYKNNHGPDPDIDQVLLLHLQTLCPHNGDHGTRVALDTGSVNSFDNSYYENVRAGRGVLESDSELWTDPRTQRFVQQFLGDKKNHELKFTKKFGRAMVKLGNVEVKTGNEGEIRRVCNKIN